MRDLRALPLVGGWDIDRTDVPALGIQGRQVLVVVEGRTGRLRSIGAPGGNLETTLRDACQTDPPGRPTTLHVPPALAAEARPLAKALGTKLVVARRSSTFDRALSAMPDLGLDLALLPADPAPWVAPLGELLEAVPWAALSPRVRLKFADGPLKDAALHVLGDDGRDRGLLLANEAVHVRHFLEARDGGTEPFEIWGVFFTPAADAQPAQVERSEAAGLRFGGWVPMICALSDKKVRRLTPAEEAAALTGLQALLQVWKAHGPRLAQEPFTTPVGAHHVVSSPVALPWVIGPHSVQYEVIDGRPAIHLSVPRRTALALTAATEGLDRLDIQPLLHGRAALKGFVGERPLGTLVEVPHSPALFALWREHSGLLTIADTQDRLAERPFPPVLTP